MHVYATGIDEQTCFCTFRIPNGEYSIGRHNLTILSILNGTIRGSTTTPFVVTDGKHNYYSQLFAVKLKSTM